MSRIRDAGDFWLKFRQARGRFETETKPCLEKSLAAYTSVAEEAAADEILEAHIREYLIDDLLAALNWQANLISEAQVTSSIDDNRIRLDYLGFGKEADLPLLIIETKRPRSPLPAIKDDKNKFDLGSSSKVNKPRPKHEESLAEIICAGLRKESLTGDWNKWLEQIREYVQSVHSKTKKPLRRVVITSGRWLILFIDPTDSFLESEQCHPDNVQFFWLTENDEEIRNKGDKDWNKNKLSGRYEELFCWLEHQRVLNETPPLTLGEVAFWVKGEQVERALHGLKLLYSDKQDFYSPDPVIKVMPVGFLRSTQGAWFRVESGVGFELPHKPEEVPNHLNEVEQKAQELLTDVNRNLGLSLRASSIEDHYANDADFNLLRGIEVLKQQATPLREEYLIVTGQHSHYLRIEPSVQNCIHHFWFQSQGKGCHKPDLPIVIRSIEERAFFKTDEIYHCSHRQVHDAKSSTITVENKSRCGARSSGEGSAFCEIWHFEKYLCCRTCVFENVCTKAKAFQLPCSKTTSP